MSGKVKITLAMLIFGSIGLFIREIPLPSGLIAMTRGLVGALFLLILSRTLKNRISKEMITSNAKFLITGGIALGVSWICLFESYRHTTIAVATLSLYFMPIFVVAASTILLKEKLTPLRAVCILAALLGMVFVSEVLTSPMQGVHGFSGIGFGIMAALCYATLTMANKFVKELPSMEATMIQIAVADILLIPYTFLSGSMEGVVITMQSAVLMVILGIVHTGLAFWLYFSSLQDLEAQTAAAISYLDPVTAIILSTLVLHERMSPMQLVGAILILGATYINVRFSSSAERNVGASFLGEESE